MYRYFSAGTHVLLFFSWYSCIVIFQLVHMYYYFSAGTHVLSFVASTHVLSFSAGTHVLLFFSWYTFIVIFSWYTFIVMFSWYSCIVIFQLVLMYCYFSPGTHVLLFFSWYTCIGMGCAVLLSVTFYYLGVLFGLCGERPSDRANCCNRGTGASLLCTWVTSYNIQSFHLTT